MWQEEAKCFQEVSPRCEGLQTHLNPGGLYLIAFDVHVNMTCFNIPALTIPSSEDQGKTKQKGGAEGSGVVGVASACTNWLPGLSILPGAKGILCPQPTIPNVFQLSSPKHPFSSPGPPVPPPVSWVPLGCVCVCACVRTCMYMLYCVSWHIIKGNSSEREKLNREGSVPWICCGWHPSILLCV